MKKRTPVEELTSNLKRRIIYDNCVYNERKSLGYKDLKKSFNKYLGDGSRNKEYSLSFLRYMTFNLYPYIAPTVILFGAFLVLSHFFFKIEDKESMSFIFLGTILAIIGLLCYLLIGAFFLSTSYLFLSYYLFKALCARNIVQMIPFSSYESSKFYQEYRHYSKELYRKNNCDYSLDTVLKSISLEAYSSLFRIQEK